MPDMHHDGTDDRLATALDAMRTGAPEIPRDAVALVAARAVLANAPAARATRWTLRAAAAALVLALGALLMPRTIAAPVDVASDAVETNLPSADATPALLPVVATSARPIVFELDAAQARSVQVLGDFNGWSRESARMQRGADGRWRLTTLLPPGRYVYAYLVDGTRFVSDPARDAVEDRDFGVTGSELVVGEAP
jgi:hypothetical protein